LRLRHTTQLRNFAAGVGADDGVLAGAEEVAFFSELEAESATDAVTATNCDMLHSKQ
jgi:hypothetical protein